MSVRINFAPNPSFESAVWAAITNGQLGSSSAVSATVAKYGTSSARLINTGTAADDCYMETQITGLQPNTSYTISGYLYIGSNTGSPNSNRAILAYAAGVVNLTTATIGSLAVGNWVRYSLTINTAAGTTLNIRLYAPPGTSYWDGILVEQGTGLAAYFDGSSSQSGFAHNWIGTPNASISTQTTVSITIPKVYQYKIESPSGQYLGMLQKVKSKFAYNQMIATTFVQTEIELSQSDPDELTVNDNLIKIWEFSSYYPNGKKVFDGYISKWKATFGGDDSMVLTCISHGQDASQYVIEAGDSAYISQATENNNYFQIGDQDAFGQSYTVVNQIFTLAANKVIGSVDVMVSTQEAADLTVIIRQRVGASPDVSSDPEVMRGTVSLASGLVKSVQHVSFNSPTQLNTGTTYYMEVAWASAGVTTCQLYCHNGNPYGNGTAWTQVFTPPASWAPAANFSGVDLYFVIYQHGGSVVTTYTNRDPTFMLSDLMDSYNQRGGLIQKPANPVTPLLALPFTSASEPGGSWGAAYAQPFTPTTDMDINIVQLYLGSSSGSTDVQVQICRGDPSLDMVDVIAGTESYTFGGSNVQIGLTNVRTISNPAPGIIGFEFTGTIHLTAGVQYYLLVEFSAFAFGNLLFKGAGSTDTIPSPFSTGYYALINSNNTSGFMTTHAANPGFYCNIGYASPVPAILDAGYASSGVTTSYTFQQQTMLRAIQVVASLLPANWYWYVSPEDNVLHVQEASTTADILIVKGRHIESLDLEATKENIINQVYFTGGDDGTGTNVSVKKTSPIGDNRAGLAQISDNRVNGAGGAAVGAIIAQDYLDSHDSETYITDISIPETTMDTELVQIGMMVGFRGFGTFVDGLLLMVVSKNKAPDGISCQIGTLPVRTSQAVADIEAGLAYIETLNNPSTPS